MKNKIKEIIKHKHFWIFLLIFVVGVFLRAYNFSDWLHFELDQSRDSIVIEEAMKGGLGELPLLGPRAAGTQLRLGPMSYYMGYVSALMTGDSIVGSAYAVLFFSILSIPLAFFVFRRQFSVNIALFLTAIFSSSLFFVTYSRFFWNPNFIPFFALAVMYCALKSVDEETKNKGNWLIALAVSFGFLSQLHFLSLVVVSGVLVAFFIYKRPKIKLKFWLAAVAIFAVLNAPIIVNEIKTKGDNTDQFYQAIFKKSEESTNTLLEKIVKNYSEHSLGYGIMLTGYQGGELPELRSKNSDLDIRCDRYCRAHLPLGILSFVLVAVGVVLTAMKIAKEKNVSKRDFLIFSLILFVFGFLAFTPLAYDLSPRFFLVSGVIPFVFLGLIFEKVSRMGKYSGLVVAVALVLVVSNLYYVVRFFDEMRAAKSENIQIGQDRILKQKTRITLEQQKEIVDYIEGVYNENNYPVFFKAQSEFHRAFANLFDRRGILRDSILEANIYAEGNYFLIIRTQSDMSEFTEKYGRIFTFEDKKDFGTLTVFTLMPKAEFITAQRIIPGQLDRNNITEEEIDEEEYARRYKWKEVFR